MRAKQTNIVLTEELRVVADAAAFIEKEPTTTAYIQSVVVDHLMAKAKDPLVIRAMLARAENEALKSGAVTKISGRRKKVNGKQPQNEGGDPI